MLGRRKREEAQQARERAWEEKPNVEKARRMLRQAESSALAPAATAAYAAATTYLLLDIAEKLAALDDATRGEGR